MSWLHAVATSEKIGFRLVLVEGQPNGVVVDQNPKAHDKAAKDSTIDVKMEILTPKIGLQPQKLTFVFTGSVLILAEICVIKSGLTVS